MREGVPVDCLAPLRCRWFGVEGAELAVVVIGGSEGGTQRVCLQARQLAASGVSVLAVGYHGFEGRPTLANIALERFAEALAWVRDEAHVARVVLHGYSRGSEAALLTAALVDQRVAAVVALVPGNVVLCSWPGGQPAWMLAGEPLPYVDSFGPTSPSAEAYIPVEDIPGPLFLVGAGMDRVWPSAAMADAISQRRRRHGHRRDVVLQYPDAGHDLALLGPATLPGPGQSLRGQEARVIINEIDSIGARQAGEPARRLAYSDRADAWDHLLSFLGSLSEPNAPEGHDAG